MSYAITLSESKQLMFWRLILEEFGPNIQSIARFDNIVANLLSTLPYKSINRYGTSASKVLCRANKLFIIGREESKKDYFPLYLFNLQIKQQKDIKRVNSKLRAYIYDKGYSYSTQALDDVEIILYNRKMYLPQSMRRYMLYWYHLCINHTGGSRLAKKTVVMLMERPCHISRAIC